MGVSNHECDDGVWNTAIDINCDDFLCSSKEIRGASVPTVIRNCSQPEIETTHICMENRIVYNQSIPSSGPHRPLWPKYGEYAYVPPQRWLHNIEHGAAVFLYHPCLEIGQIEALRAVAIRTIPKKHIITPYNLPKDLPLAVVTWRCVLQMNAVDVHKISNFVDNTALNGPEGTDVDGQYDIGFEQNLSQFIGTEYCLSK